MAGYRGTGSIYLDGQLVGNEGRHVFDIGLLADPSIANIHNKDYKHITDLKAPELWDPAWGMPNGFTGSYGFALSGFADNVTVINVPVDSFMDAPFSQRALEITGNAGENSHITFEYAPDYRYKNFSPVMTISFDAKNIVHADAGTLSFKTNTVYIDSGIPEVREFWKYHPREMRKTPYALRAMTTISVKLTLPVIRRLTSPSKQFQRRIEIHHQSHG